MPHLIQEILPTGGDLFSKNAMRTCSLLAQCDIRSHKKRFAPKERLAHVQPIGPL